MNSSRKRTSVETTGPASKSLRRDSKDNETSPCAATEADASTTVLTKHPPPTILRAKKAVESTTSCKPGSEQPVKSTTPVRHDSEKTVESISPVKPDSKKAGESILPATLESGKAGKSILPAKLESGKATESILPTKPESGKAVKLITPVKLESTPVQNHKPDADTSSLNGNKTKKIPIKVVRSTSDTMPLKVVRSTSDIVPIKVVRTTSDTMPTQKFVLSTSAGPAQRNQQYVLVQKDLAPNFQNNFDKILSLLQNPTSGNVNVMLLKQQPGKMVNNGDASVTQNTLQQVCKSSIVTINQSVLQSGQSETKCKSVTASEPQAKDSKATVVSGDVVKTPTQEHKNEKKEEEIELIDDSSDEASQNVVDTNDETSNQSTEQEITVVQNTQEKTNSPQPLKVTKVIPLRAVTMSKPESKISGGVVSIAPQSKEIPERDMKPHTIFLTKNQPPPPPPLAAVAAAAATNRSTETKSEVKEMSKLEACLKQPFQAKSTPRKKLIDPLLGGKMTVLPVNDQVKLQALEIKKLRDENQKLRDLNTTLQSRLNIVYQLSQSQQRQEEMLLRVMEQLPHLAAGNNPSINSHIFPPVSTMINNEVHLGQGVWLAKREYDRVMNVATTPSLLVRNLGVAVYGEEVLKQSSVLGKPCMRFSDRASRPPLSPTRYTAIRETFDFWLTKHGYCGQSKLDELTHVTQYLGSKIQDLNRPEHLKYKYRSKKKVESEASDTAQSGPSSAPPRPRGTGRRKKKRILPFPPEWNQEMGGEDWQESVDSEPYIKLEPGDEDSQDAQDFLESLGQTSSSNE